MAAFCDNISEHKRSQQDFVIRMWRPGDETGVWDVLKEGSFSNVPISFMTIMMKRRIIALIVVLGAIVLGHTGNFLAGLLTVAVVLCGIYSAVWISALFYVYGPPLWDMKDVTTNYLLNEDGTFLIAEANKKIIGTIAVVKQETGVKSNLKIAWLRRMAVLRCSRGKGVAKALVNKTIEFCKSQNYDKIELITTTVHHAARNLYVKSGFSCRDYKPYKYFKGLITIWTYEYELDLSKNQ